MLSELSIHEPSRGEGSCSGEEVGGYGGDDLGEIVFDVVGAKPYDAIAAGFEECLALGVFLVLTFVNRAVDLHDETMAGTEEIDHEGADGMLASNGSPSYSTCRVQKVCNRYSRI